MGLALSLFYGGPVKKTTLYITDLSIDRHICSNFEDMLMLGPLKCKNVNLNMNIDRKRQWSEFSIDADPKARNKTTKAAKKEKQGLISE